MKPPPLYFIVLLALLTSLSSASQTNPYWQEPSRLQADSLTKVLQASKNDTVNMYINRQLGMYYQEINRMAALNYYEEMLQCFPALLLLVSGVCQNLRVDRFSKD